MCLIFRMYSVCIFQHSLGNIFFLKKMFLLKNIIWYFLSASWFCKSCAWKVKVTQSCPTLCDPMDCTVHGILQARILEWVAFPFARGSSQPREWTQVFCTAGNFYQLIHREAHTPGKLFSNLGTRIPRRLWVSMAEHLSFHKQLGESEDHWS